MPLTATTVLLARHGETDDNRRLVFQGQGGHGLNARGRAQAERLGARMRLFPPDVIVASDLERAVETASIVAEACGRDLVLDPDLREVDVGTWTGRSYAEIERLHPEEWAAWSGGIDVRRGGGETYAELAERVGRAVARHVRANARQRILFVSHGGAIKAYVTRLLGIPAEGLRALAGVGNCALASLEHDGWARARLHAWNDVAHLEGLVLEGDAG